LDGSKKPLFFTFNLDDDEKRTLVANVGSVEHDEAAIQPGGAVRVSNGFGGFMGERVVGGVDQLAIRRIGADATTRDVLKRFDGVKELLLTDVETTVVRAEGKTVSIIRRLAY
jgi:hypothetical protein